MMNKYIPRKLLRISNIVAVVLVIFLLASTFFKRSYLPWATLEKTILFDKILSVSILVAYCMMGVSIWFTSLKLIPKIIVFIVILPFLCYNSIGVLEGSKRVDSVVEMNGFRYYLVSDHYLGENWDFYNLYRCYINGKYCEPIESFSMQSMYGSRDNSVVVLVSDQDSEKIYVFQNGIIYFIYDASYQNFDPIDSKDIRGNSYHLEADDKPVGTEIILSRCDQETHLNCEVLFLSMVDSVPENSKLDYDKETRILSILLDQASLFEFSVP